MTIDQREPDFFRRSHKVLAIVVAVLILAYAPWARPIQEWLRMNLGGTGMKYLMAALFLLGGACLAFSARLWRLPAKNLLLLGALFAAGLIYSLCLPLPEERVHLMQFGLLGVLAYPSFKGKKETWWKRVPLPLLFVFSIGIADEVFQWFLPDRYGDLRDVFFNALGGIWGIAICIILNAKGGKR